MVKQVLCVIGTRPEAIKMAPVVQQLQHSSWCKVKVIATGQHKELLDQMLQQFDIVVDENFDVMHADQTLPELTARLPGKLDKLLGESLPDLVLAQGDTTTVFMVALACFYRKVPFAHLEAGLRTADLYNPFPEEMNRVLVSRLTALHFAPTDAAKFNLLKEGINEQSIHMVGNTVIDSLLFTANQKLVLPAEVPENKRLILVTAHRRENFGDPLASMCDGMLILVNNNSDVHIVYPVHPNPNVRDIVFSKLAEHPQITLCEPLDYSGLVAVLQQSYLVLTDSGGLQEEAPALSKPVLVMRDDTERPEAVASGVSKLVGTNADNIAQQCQLLLDNQVAYLEMAKGVSPYGDGKASERICKVIANYFAS